MTGMYVYSWLQADLHDIANKLIFYDCLEILQPDANFDTSKSCLFSSCIKIRYQLAHINTFESILHCVTKMYADH